MMYVIYNNDGSIRYTNLCEIITKNSNNVSEIFISVDGYDTDDYNCDATFELSNETVNSLVATVDSLVLDTTTYYGWKFSLTSAQTACPGELLMSAMLKDLSDNILFTFPINLFVNNTPLNPDETLISVSQYNNLRDAMLTKQDKFGVHTLRIYAEMGDANADLSNLVVGQLVYVIAENKLFQVDGSPKALVLTNDNYVKQYPYNLSTTLQTIYDEVGLGKLFYALIDNVWTLLMLKDNVDGYSLLFWNELGYGETDTIQDLSETINNFNFYFTGSYFPYVEKNDLSGSLTDNELAILSQPNSVFICLGNIMHKVSSTRFERISATISGTNMTITTLYITINTSTKTFAFNTSYISSYNASGIDSFLAQKQNLLINQFNIKSINGQSILGSGNLDVGGGSVAEWGNIGGDIADQTDLQNELQDIREVAEGKSKTLAFRAEETAITSSNFNIYDYKKADGTSFEDFADFLNYVNAEYEGDLHLINTDFLSQNGSIQLYDGVGGYLLYYIGSDQWIVYTLQYITENYKTGDIFLIDELNYPDRWFKVVSGGYYYFNKLETSKIDLSSYATKTDLSNAIVSLNANLAGLYDENTIYAKGQVVIHDNKLWSANQDITTPEAWDSTHWTQTTIANEFVNLHGSQVIDGLKAFVGEVDFKSPTENTLYRFEIRDYDFTFYRASEYFFAWYYNIGIVLNKKLVSSNQDLGSSSYTWKDLYLSGIAYVNKHSFETNGTKLDVKYEGNLIFELDRTALIPQSYYGSVDLGTASYKFKDLYLSGALKDSNNSYTIAESMAQFNYSVAGTTVIKWSQFCSFSLSADTTLTLETTKTNCLCEYKANITNSGGSAITITLPSGTAIKGNVSISSNTFVIPSGSSVEVNILNNKAIVVEW